VDPDPQGSASFGSLDPHPYQIKIRIRIKIYKLDPEPDPHQFANVKPKCREYSVANPDPGSAFLTPGSGIGFFRFPDLGIFVVAIFGSGIRDGLNSGSGINIPDPQH
jgi:hypothetical protein